MITDNTCKECGKEKCPKKEHLHGGNGMGLCHGHESEGEKESQPKVCEKGFCCQHKVGHSCCHGSCSPLPPKDGKGEKGWELEFDDNYCRDRFRRTRDGDWKELGVPLWKVKAFIRQVAAQARREGREEMAAKGREAIETLPDCGEHGTSTCLCELTRNRAIERYDQSLKDLNTKEE